MFCAEANKVTIRAKRMKIVFFIVLGWLINSLGAKILIFVTLKRKIVLEIPVFDKKNEIKL